MSKPIIFNGEMVRAILNGSKTQTRRVISPQPIGFNEPEGWPIKRIDDNGTSHFILPPYGNAGQSLYVRESWRTIKEYDNVKPSEIPKDAPIFYEANHEWQKSDEDLFSHLEHGKLRPSIFLPKWASRIFPKITNLKIERVADISWQDALSEGVEKLGANEDGNAYRNYHGGIIHWLSPVLSFETLWDSINGQRKEGK